MFWIPGNAKGNQDRDRKLSATLARGDSNPVLSTTGAHRVLVSRPAFKAGVSGQKLEGWVRFPHAPARLFSLLNGKHVHTYLEISPRNTLTTVQFFATN